MKKLIIPLYYLFILLISVILLIQCKTQKIIPSLIDESLKPSLKKLENNYYKYDNIGTFNSNNKQGMEPIVFKPIIYTNIEKNPNNLNFPRRLFSPSMEEKNYEYFEKKLNGEYVLYTEKEGRIIMREYAKWYDFDKDRHTQDSIKVLSSRLDTDEKVFDYLKKNNIKYKLINIEKYLSECEIKILLEANKSYVYITISPYYIISNMYYNAKDTLYLNNNFGRSLFR